MAMTGGMTMRADQAADARAAALPPVRRRPWSSRAAPAHDVLADGFLKLMLVLLVLFLFLHGRTVPAPERAAPVLDALAQRFAGSGMTQAAPEDGAMRLAAPLLAAGATLHGQILGQPPVTARAVGTAGAIVAFDLADASLFDGEAAIRRERLVLLRRLAMALDDPRAAPGAVLVITTGWPAASLDVAMARLLALGHAMRAAGLDPSRLRLGFSPLPEAAWRFAIRQESLDAPARD